MFCTAASRLLLAAGLLCTSNAARSALLDLLATPPPTSPLSCITDTGKHVPVGHSITELEAGACRVCECSYHGISCTYTDCTPPMCVDYVRTGCCYTCPNGQNCLLPSGELIIAPVERDGMKCECPGLVTTVPGVPSDRYSTAICTPVTTNSVVG